jgi:lysozyme
MEWTAILKLLPYVVQGIDLARKINADKTGGSKVIDIVRTELPDALDLFRGVGQTLFPELTTPSEQVAAAAVVLDTGTTKKVQGQLNKLGAAPQLTVDGSYGAKTKAAVMAFQKANPPLAADGWAGAETQKVLNSKAG